MASEAQKLIGISLTKIAQSRSHRGGVSLHKNLLVATVLQKARYIFMEEAYNMVHYQHHHQPPAPVMVQQQAPPRSSPIQPTEDLIGLTAEEAGLESTSLPDETSSTTSTTTDFHQPTCVKCADINQDKENHPPTYDSSNETLTYLDLDKSSNVVLRERSNTSSTSATTSSSLKRRRAVAEWETEEAVQSILPKRTKLQQQQHHLEDEEDDNVFLDDVEDEDDAATILSETVSREIAAEEELEQSNRSLQLENNIITSSNSNGSSAMEIDRITSLVSIFSFSMTAATTSTGDSGSNSCSTKICHNNSSSNRSTPDLCSAQAKDTTDSLQQRQFLAMTV